MQPAPELLLCFGQVRKCFRLPHPVNVVTSLMENL
jgi:hypothetical protein